MHSQPVLIYSHNASLKILDILHECGNYDIMIKYHNCHNELSPATSDSCHWRNEAVNMRVATTVHALIETCAAGLLVLFQVLIGGLPVALSEVDCRGDEASITDCPARTSGITRCGFRTPGRTDATVVACANTDTTTGRYPRMTSHGIMT